MHLLTHHISLQTFEPQAYFLIAGYSCGYLPYFLSLRDTNSEVIMNIVKLVVVVMVIEEVGMSYKTLERLQTLTRQTVWEHLTLLLGAICARCVLNGVRGEICQTQDPWLLFIRRS